MNKYYPVEPVNIHIESLINIILENNWVITTKKGKGKLLIFCGNVERLIHIYAVDLWTYVHAGSGWGHSDDERYFQCFTIVSILFE